MTPFTSLLTGSWSLCVLCYRCKPYLRWVSSYTPTFSTAHSRQSFRLILKKSYGPSPSTPSIKTFSRVDSVIRILYFIEPYRPLGVHQNLNILLLCSSSLTLISQVLCSPVSSGTPDIVTWTCTTTKKRGRVIHYLVVTYLNSFLQYTNQTQVFIVRPPAHLLSNLYIVL